MYLENYEIWFYRVIVYLSVNLGFYWFKNYFFFHVCGIQWCVKLGIMNTRFKSLKEISLTECNHCHCIFHLFFANLNLCISLMGHIIEKNTTKSTFAMKKVYRNTIYRLFIEMIRILNFFFSLVAYVNGFFTIGLLSSVDTERR